MISLDFEWIHWFWLNKDNKFIGMLNEDHWTALTCCNACILHPLEFYHTQITIDTLRCLTFIVQLISYPGFVISGGLDVYSSIENLSSISHIRKSIPTALLFVCTGQDVCPRRRMSAEWRALHDRCWALQRVQESWRGRLIGLGGLSNLLSDHSQQSRGTCHRVCHVYLLL